MYQNLEHLNTEELNNLMKRYYNNESVNLLVKEYNLDIRPNFLYKFFPPEIIEGESCEYCGNWLVRDRKSKSNRNIVSENKSEYYCPKCDHRPYSKKCDCSNCIDVLYNKSCDIKAKIQEVYGQCEETVSLESLDLEERVILGVLSSKLLKEDMYHFMPFCEYQGKLTPSIDFAYTIFRKLHKREVLKVSPLSDITAFKADVEEFPRIFYLDKVIYYLNIDFEVSKSDTFEKLLHLEFKVKDDFNHILDLWRKICVEECKEYLVFVLNRVGFEFNPGEKTQKVFELLLNDYSVSQIFGIIKKQVDRVSALYLEKGLNRKHAANMVIGYCERYAERAKSEGWSLIQYNRPYELPQSDISFFFFYNVLKIGDKGFRMSINEFRNKCIDEF